MGHSGGKSAAKIEPERGCGACGALLETRQIQDADGQFAPLIHADLTLCGST
jgi:hypothetical protein